MAIEVVVLDLPAKNTSGGAIAQFSVVCYDTTNAFGAVQPGNANAGPVMGINQSRGVDSNGAEQANAQNGDSMQVRVMGVSRAVADAVTVISAPLYAKTSTGTGTNASPYQSNVTGAANSANGNGTAPVVGYGLEAGTTQGDIVSVYLAPALQPAFKQLGTFAAPLTANGVANTAQTHAHGLGYIPQVVIIVGIQGTSGLVSLSAAPDATNITEKSPVVSATFIAYVA